MFNIIEFKWYIISSNLPIIFFITIFTIRLWSSFLKYWTRASLHNGAPQLLFLNKLMNQEEEEAMEEAGCEAGAEPISEAAAAEAEAAGHNSFSY